MKSKVLIFIVVFALLITVPSIALASGVPSFNYATPVFGLAAAPDGSLLVADAGQGIVQLRQDSGKLLKSLPGVTDIAPLGRGVMFAITAGQGSPDSISRLYRVARGNVKELANLGAFEAAVNPDGGEVDSNPFDVAALTGGKALVADAGGNDLLIVNQKGKVDWIATFPSELVPTAHIKSLVNCPNPPAGYEFICGLPEMMPAEAVATSVAVGPDGAYYVGELKGFPNPVGLSRVWRIEPGTRHADCATSSACSVVLDGFTSVVDLAFRPDGKLYVVEFDEAGFWAVEGGLPGLTQGGTVNLCDLGAGTCSVAAGSLPMPIAVAVDKKGASYAAIASLIPGAAQVIALP